MFGGWSIWRKTPSSKKEEGAEENIWLLVAVSGACCMAGSIPGIALSNSCWVLVGICFSVGPDSVSLAAAIFFWRKQCPSQSIVFFSQAVSAIAF